MNYASIEDRILSRVVDTKDFHSLEKSQITEQYFQIPINKEVYRYLREVYYHPQSVGQVPSRDLVMERFPNTFFFVNGCMDSVPVLAQELRREKVRLELLILSQNIQLEAEKDPLSAKATLLSEAARISALAEVGEDLSLAGSYQTLLTNYEMIQTSGGMIGIPFPWHPVNDETQGMLPEQFVVLYGRPGSMKSFLAIYMACHAYLVSRRRVLFYTREMSPILVAQRMAACINNVSYKAFKNGQLQPDTKKRVFETLQDLLEDEKSAGIHTDVHPGIFIVSDRGATGSGGGVSWLRSKIRDIKPHIAFVDGMYLMKDDRTNQRTIDWKAIAHISQDLKLTGQEFGIPIVGVTQANRASQKSSGQDLTELAFTDALGQDADVVMRVSKKDRIDENKLHRTELWLTFPKIREGALQGIVVGGEPCTDFLYKRALTSNDYDDDEPTPTKGPQKPKFQNSYGPKAPLVK